MGPRFCEVTEGAGRAGRSQGGGIVLIQSACSFCALRSRRISSVCPCLMASSRASWKGVARAGITLEPRAGLACHGDAGGVGGIRRGRGSGCGIPHVGRNFRMRSLLTMTRAVVGSPCVPVRRRMRDLRKLFRSPSIFQTLSPLTLRPRKICCLVWPEEVSAVVMLVMPHTVVRVGGAPYLGYRAPFHDTAWGCSDAVPDM